MHHRARRRKSCMIGGSTLGKKETRKSPSNHMCEEETPHAEEENESGLKGEYSHLRVEVVKASLDLTGGK